MRLFVFIALLAAAPLAAQTPSSTFITGEPDPALRTNEALSRPPTERYGVEWGMTRGDLVDVFPGPPDDDRPEGITYLGPSGGQIIYLFSPDATGTDRLTSVVDASPLLAHLLDALAEAREYEAALTARYGPPYAKDEPREDSGDPPVTDTTWVLSGMDERGVTLTVDHIPTESGALGHLFYVRTNGPPATP